MTPTLDPSPIVGVDSGNPTTQGTPALAARPTSPKPMVKPRLRTFRNIQGRKLAKSKHNGACPGAFGRQGARRGRGGAVQADSSPIIPSQS